MNDNDDSKNTTDGAGGNPDDRRVEADDTTSSRPVPTPNKATKRKKKAEREPSGTRPTTPEASEPPPSAQGDDAHELAEEATSDTSEIAASESGDDARGVAADADASQVEPGLEPPRTEPARDPFSWLGTAVRRLRDDVTVGTGRLIQPAALPLASCPECGTRRVKSDQRFCTQCRAQLRDLTQPSPGGPVSPQGRAWGLAAVVVVVLIIIAAATSSGASSTSADNVVPATTPETSSNQFTPPTDTSPPVTTPTTPTGTPIPESRLAPGDCFYFDGQPNAVNDAQPRTQVDTVSCDGPHPFETVSVLTYPGAVSSAYPGDETVNAYANQQCTPQYNSYIAGSSLSLANTYTYPSAASWPTGDRTIVCYLKDSSGQLLTSAVGGTTSTTSPPAPPSAQSTINTDGVYVRTGPGSTAYPEIATLNSGDPISILCVTQGETEYGNSQWDQININGQTGYVSDALVNDNGASPPSC